MGIRSKTAFLSGTITNNPLAVGGTTLNSAGLSSLPAIVAPDIAVIVLDPTGSAGAPEIVWVTAHTASATSATIARGKESSSAREHASGIAWVHGPTITDIEEEPAYAIERELNGSGLYRNVSRLGTPIVGQSATVGEANNVGVGWAIIAAGTSGAYSGANVSGGKCIFSTGTTSGGNVCVFGANVTASQDPTIIFRGNLLNEASRSIFIGFVPAGVIDPLDANNRIGFRVLTSGNIVGVSDSAGTETTRDTGAVPAGASVLTTLIVRISDGGTIVRFYQDGVQVGADVITNIPSVELMPLIGIANTTTADKLMYVVDAAYWREM